MPKQDEQHLEKHHVAKDDAVSRRGFLGRISASALGVVAAASALTTGKAAHATYPIACCNLWYPPSSSCSSACHHISGYQGRSWWCYSGSTFYECFECTAGNSCWEGPWACSDYWQVS